MQAIILAAGMGKRLGELTGNNTKCMIRVNGKTLIERMLGQLDRLGLNRITIVIGYKGQVLRDFISTLDIRTPVDYVTNDIFDRTNNIYSLFLARERMLEDDTLLLESDLIFEDRVIDRIIRDERPNIALVAGFENWMSGTVVTIDESGNITRFVDAEHFSFKKTDSYYKTVNIYKFSREFSASHYVPFLEAYCTALGNNEYYEQVLSVISRIDRSSLKALPLECGEAWYEIDDIQDLDIAETIFSDRKTEAISSRYGGYWRYPGMLDFCYLVNPYFPNKRMTCEIKSNFRTLISHYPSGRRVNNLIAARNFMVRPSYITVGNGAAELIKSLMENVITGKTGFVFPTFEEYPNRLRTEDRVVFVPDNPDFSYTAEDLTGYFSDKGISALVIVNPDNPSGNFMSRDEVLSLCAWAGEKGIRLVIDESFVDFSSSSQNNSLIDNNILEKYPHLAVVRSISKSYGVAGLRLGVLASSDRELMSAVNSDLAIWNINSFAEFYMQIFEKYLNDYRKACARFIRERERFLSELDGIGFLRIIPSRANYFLCEVLHPFTSSGLTEELLEKYNILIKDCSRKKGFGGRNYVRIAVRDKKDNSRLIDILKKLQCSL